MLPKLEPLIHYAQKQAENSELEVPIPADKFSWSWLRLLLEKGAHHSNGWIRVWILQRAIKLPKVLHQDYEVSKIVKVIMFENSSFSVHAYCYR